MSLKSTPPELFLIQTTLCGSNCFVLSAKDVKQAIHPSDLWRRRFPWTPDMILYGGPYFCPMQRPNLLNHVPLYGTVLFYRSPSALAVKRAVLFIMSRFKEEIRNLSAFKAWVMGTGTKKHLKLGLDRSKVDNSSWEAICFIYHLSGQGGKGNQSPIGLSKASITCPYLENIHEGYKENVSRNSVCFQYDDHVYYHLNRVKGVPLIIILAQQTSIRTAPGKSRSMATTVMKRLGRTLILPEDWQTGFQALHIRILE